MMSKAKSKAKDQQKAVIEQLKQAGISVEIGLKKPNPKDPYFSRVGANKT